jgi:hypothetical protein
VRIAFTQFSIDGCSMGNGKITKPFSLYRSILRRERSELILLKLAHFALCSSAVVCV